MFPEATGTASLVQIDILMNVFSIDQPEDWSAMMRVSTKIENSEMFQGNKKFRDGQQYLYKHNTGTKQIIISGSHWYSALTWYWYSHPGILGSF